MWRPPRYLSEVWRSKTSYYTSISPHTLSPWSNFQFRLISNLNHLGCASPQPLIFAPDLTAFMRRSRGAEKRIRHCQNDFKQWLAASLEVFPTWWKVFRGANCYVFQVICSNLWIVLNVFVFHCPFNGCHWHNPQFLLWKWSYFYRNSHSVWRESHTNVNRRPDVPLSC